MQFHITIDGVAVDATSEEANLVEVADRVGIGIPAPCYRDNHRGGCCKGCVVEVDGSQAYACGTAPKEGMNIVVNRHDLVALRKKWLAAYAAGIAGGFNCGCSGSTSSCCNPSANSRCC